MFIRSAKKVLKKVEGCDICVFGAGMAGREIVDYLTNYGVNILCIYDNDEYLYNKKILGVPIRKPDENMDKDIIYVISVSEEYRNDICDQLETMGIVKEKQVIYSPWRDYDYMKSLDESEYKDEISARFLECIGYDMNWDNPQTYNEIINWEKLYNRDERKVMLADKVLAREWVKNKIGDKYVINQFGVWESADIIDFDYLPQRFVLKTNNGSGRNIIVTDVDKLDISKTVAELDAWLKKDFFTVCLEWQYKNIYPQIICEELLDTKNDDFYDLKVYCFRGEPEYIHCIKDEHEETMRARFYSTNWEVLDFNHCYPDDERIIDKPNCLDELLEKTMVLCKDFDHVRVDWYLLPNKTFLFSEMTFSSWGGVEKFRPAKYDLLLGEMIRGEK